MGGGQGGGKPSPLGGSKIRSTEGSTDLGVREVYRRHPRLYGINFYEVWTQAEPYGPESNKFP